MSSSQPSPPPPPSLSRPFTPACLELAPKEIVQLHQQELKNQQRAQQRQRQQQAQQHKQQQQQDEIGSMVAVGTTTTCSTAAMGTTRCWDITVQVERHVVDNVRGARCRATYYWPVYANRW